MIDMTGKYRLNERHEPVPVTSLEEWAKAFELANRRVARDEVGEVEVSTVFLAIDHNWAGGWAAGRPILFETMIFGGPHDLYCERYCTWDEAEAGHARVVAALREGIDPGAES